MLNSEIRNQLVDSEFSTADLFALSQQKDDAQVARVALALYLRRRKLAAGY